MLKRITSIFLIIYCFSFCESNDSMEKASNAMKAGLYKQALTHIIDAKENNQKNPDIYRLKALLHEALEEYDKAIISWEKCLKYSNNNALSNEARIHINSLNIK